MSAFEAAMAAGFGFELDVQCSADGVAMVFHDATLDRLTAETGPLGSRTAVELARITLKGTTDTIPTLAAVLARAQGRAPVLVEVKGNRFGDNRLEQSVAEAILAHPGAVAVMSFWPESVAWFRDNLPGVARGLVATTRPDPELGIEVTRARNQIEWLSELDADFIAYDIKCLGNPVSMTARRYGLPVLTWTMRTAADRARAKAWADEIIFEQETL